MVGVDEGTLILYNKQTNSWWNQLFGKAVSGPMEGKQLVKLPSTMTTWAKWKILHPDTTVYVKRSIPYDQRFTRETFEKIARMEDGPIRSNDLVVGLEGHVTSRAYLVRRLTKNRLVNDMIEGQPIAVYLSEDLTTARVLDRKVDGKTLSLEISDGDQLQDRETGTSWDPLTGEAVAGPLKGKRLEPLVSTYSLWFAWKKYRPDTEIYGEVSSE